MLFDSYFYVESVEGVPMNQPNRIAPSRRAFLINSALATTVLLASACGSPAASRTQGADTGKEIKDLKVALPGSVSSLYIGQEAGVVNYYVASVTQEGLVKVGVDGNVEPALAESWTQPNPSTYVYKLRADAKFQDGTPVTVEDVIFSLDKARDAKVSPNLHSTVKTHTPDPLKTDKPSYYSPA